MVKMGISELRKNLHDSIKKYGIDSKYTYMLSVQLDEKIVEYYENCSMKILYQKSYQGFCEYKHVFGRKPSRKEWNHYAVEKDYLCSESMKYIGDIKFR